MKGVYFIGIGGIGTSALARWFLAQKWLVFGSDIAESEITKSLAKEGIKIKIGHKSTNLITLARKINLVISSQAIRESNPEVKIAKKIGIPILTYPQALGLISEYYNQVLAVAGAHGKSTTTALLALILKKAGFNPTVIVGTKLKEFKKENFRAGKTKYLIFEADEYGKAFLNYSPTLTIITNIDREHLDIYKNLKKIKKNFFQFLSQTKENGFLILNNNDENLHLLKNKIQKMATQKNLKVIWYSLKLPVVEKTRKHIKIPGEHNVSNALAAISAAKALGISLKVIFKAVANYRGSWRRMEYKGKFKISNPKLKIKVFDDYAHHPTEIKATLKAFGEKFPSSKIICIFEPHQSKRLELLFNDFVDSFKKAHILILLPTYKVVGRDSNNCRFSARKLAYSIKKKYPRKLIFYLPRPNYLPKLLKKIIKNDGNNKDNLNYILVMMGAGGIVNYTKFLIN